MVRKLLAVLLSVMLFAPAALACDHEAQAGEASCTCPSGGDCSCKEKCKCTAGQVENDSASGSCEAPVNHVHIHRAGL